MLRTGQFSLFGNADLGRERFLAFLFVDAVALEQAADVADAGFELVDGPRFFEGLAAAEVVGFLSLARSVAGHLGLARGVDVVGGAFGGHFCGNCKP